MLNHIVLLKLKKDISAELVNEMYKQMVLLKDKIQGIESITHGTNNSPEGLDKGYTEGFVVVFKDASARDEYLTNEDHMAIAKEYVLPISENVLVFDYEF